MTGELDPLSPMTKKLRLLEIMDYLSNPNGVAEALGSIPPDSEDYQDLGVVQISRLKYYYFILFIFYCIHILCLMISL